MATRPRMAKRTGPAIVARLSAGTMLRPAGYPTDRAVWTCPRCSSPRYADERSYLHTDENGHHQAVCQDCMTELRDHYDRIFVRWSTTDRGSRWIARSTP